MAFPLLPPGGLSRVQARIAEIQARFGQRTALTPTSTPAERSGGPSKSFLALLDQKVVDAAAAKPAPAPKDRAALAEAARAKKGFLPAVEQWRSATERIAKEEGVDPELVLAMMQQESGGKADISSAAGAQGLMQLMPSTAKGMGLDPTIPEENIRGGARYIRTQLDRFGTLELALAAYNAGPNAVRAYGNKVPPFPETQNYIANVLALYGSAAKTGKTKSG